MRGRRTLLAGLAAVLLLFMWHGEHQQAGAPPAQRSVGNLVKLSPWPARARSGKITEGSVTTAAEDDAGPSLLLSPPAPLGTDVCGGAAVSFPPPREDRVYCMVPFLWAPKGSESAQKWHAMLTKTWGQRCDVLRFFVDPVKDAADAAALPPNVIQMHELTRTYNSTQCGDPPGPCKHIWEKVWRMFVWVAEHEIDQAEWFVKLDSDSYLLPSNVQRLVRTRGWTSDELHYFGNTAGHRSTHLGKTPFVLGAAVIQSKALMLRARSIWKAMPRIDTFSTDVCADINGQTEELTTAVCFLEKLKLGPDDATQFHREPVLVFHPLGHLNMNRSSYGSWYWENRDPKTLDLRDCCSAYPMAFHNFKRMGEHSESDRLLYTDQKVPQPEEMLSYYRRIAANLRLLKTPLTVTYACSAGPRFVRALVQGLFPERTVRLQSVSVLTISVGDIAVLVASSSNDTQPVGEYCTNARGAPERADVERSPFIIMLAPDSEPCKDDAQRCGECDLVVSKSQVSGRQQAAAVTADSDPDQAKPIGWPRVAQLLATGAWDAVGETTQLAELLTKRSSSASPTKRPDVPAARPSTTARFAAIRVGRGAEEAQTGLLVGEALFKHLVARHRAVDLVLVDRIKGSVALVRGETPETETPVGLQLLGRGAGFETEASAGLFRDHRFAVVVSEGMSGAVLTKGVISAVVAGAIPVVVGLAEQPPDADQVGSGSYVYCQFDATPALSSHHPTQEKPSPASTVNGSFTRYMAMVDAVVKEQNGRLATCLAKIEGHRPGSEAFMTGDGALFDIDRMGRRIRSRLIDTYPNPYPHLTGVH